MVDNSNEANCDKCNKTYCIAMCHGCQKSFCTKHFLKHRVYLAQTKDNLHYEYEILRKEINEDHSKHPFFAQIQEWEQKAIAKLQEIAEKKRNDFQQWLNKHKTDTNILLNKISNELQSNDKLDNYTELDLDKLSEQLLKLRNLINILPPISLKIDKTIFETNSEKSIRSVDEHFVKMFGQCKLSDDDSVVTNSNYHAGISQVTGVNKYSSGIYSINFLVEEKGMKNVFFGIHSLVKPKSSKQLDQTFYGWWNLDYLIINGESQINNDDEIIQTGDKITFIIDCDNKKIRFEHHRTKRLVDLPIQLELCPFPWKIIVRLLGDGDCVRILKN